MTLRKVNFNVPVIDVTGEPIQDGTETLNVKTIISRTLAQVKADDKVMERWELARKIYTSTGEIEITPSQKLLIENAVKESTLVTFAAAQIMSLIN